MIIKISQLTSLRKSALHKKIVFAGGTFDLLHKGHIKFLKNLRKFGDIVVIAITTDKRVRQRKGVKRPILDEQSRLAIVDAIRYVDYAVIAPEPNRKQLVPTMRLIAKLKPDVFVSIQKRWLPFKTDLEGFGTRLKIIPRGNIDSTSRIIKRILNRYR